MVRNKIKMFAHQKVTLPRGRHKIIILDEADRYGCNVTCSYAGTAAMSHVLMSVRLQCHMFLCRYSCNVTCSYIRTATMSHVLMPVAISYDHLLYSTLYMYV